MDLGRKPSGIFRRPGPNKPNGEAVDFKSVIGVSTL